MTTKPLPFSAIAFDIDDTLTESKQTLKEDMGTLLGILSTKVPVAIISGAKLEQITEQLIKKVLGGRIENFYLFPNSGASAYTFTEDGTLKELYQNNIQENEWLRIKKVAEKILDNTDVNKGYHIFGDVLEWRNASIAISLLGQKTPKEQKKIFDPEQKKRKLLLPFFQKELPDYSFGIGGDTTIDITQKGIDKAYGMRHFAKILSLPEENILYVGDALYEGGNDHAVLSTKLKVHAVKNSDETKVFLTELLKEEL